MRIKLHIERLVLDSLPVSRTQAQVVRTTVERELTQLLTTQGFSDELRGGGALSSLRAGNIRLEKRPQPATVGKQIAGALHRGIGRKR